MDLFTSRPFLQTKTFLKPQITDDYVQSYFEALISNTALSSFGKIFQTSPYQSVIRHSVSIYFPFMLQQEKI